MCPNLMKTERFEPSKLDRPEILDIIFHPRAAERSPSCSSATDHYIDLSTKGVALSCRFHHVDNDAPVILHFHGNGEIVSDYDTIGGEFTAVGLNIFFATYRGYGSSGGSPSVSTLFSDNVKIAAYLMDYLKNADCKGALFAMGRSLGSASAIDLVSRYPDDFKGLILDSGFADTLPLLKRLGCDMSQNDISEADCFNNIDKIRSISQPTMIIHGGRDLIIPVAEAEKLQAESGARTKQFHIVPGADHNSLIGIGGSLYFETIKNFIDTVSGKNTWRQRRQTYKQKRASSPE